MTTSNFKDQAQTYYNTVSESLFAMLCYDECTVEDIFNYVKDERDTWAASEILVQMHESRVTRDESFAYLNSSSIREKLDTKLMEYGLELSYKQSEDPTDYTQDYFCFLITCGGPHAEVRLYENDRIEFIYSDGWEQETFNATYEQEFRALRDYFDNAGELNYQYAREEVLTTA